MNVHEAVATYRLQLEANGRSQHTIAQVRRHLAAFDIWLASEFRPRDVTQIGIQDVSAFLASPVARTRADGRAKLPTSMNAMRSSLRSFFSWCESADFVAKSPARLVRRAGAAAPPPRPIAPDDLRRLLDHLEAATDQLAARDRALIGTLAATGARISSVLALDVEHVDVASGEIDFASAKNGHALRLPIPTRMVAQLREAIGNRTRGPVFTTRCGAACRRLCRRQAARILARRLRAAGVTRRTPLHGFRHAFAMRLYTATGDVAAVQAALGHRSIASTLVYAKPSPSRLSSILRTAIA